MKPQQSIPVGYLLWANCTTMIIQFLPQNIHRILLECLLEAVEVKHALVYLTKTMKLFEIYEIFFYWKPKKTQHQVSLVS